MKQNPLSVDAKTANIIRKHYKNDQDWKPESSNATWFAMNDFELFWEENKKVYQLYHQKESDGEKRNGFQPNSVPQPSMRCQNVYGDLRDTSNVGSTSSNQQKAGVDTSQRFPKFDSKLGKKSLFYGWASLRDVLDMEGPMKRQELPGDESVSLRAALNKPPPGGVYWETGRKDYSIPQMDYKNNVAHITQHTKLYSASEKEKVARVSTALADAQISGKTFQELFGKQRKEKKHVPRAKAVRQAVNCIAEPPESFRIHENLPPPRKAAAENLHLPSPRTSMSNENSPRQTEFFNQNVLEKSLDSQRSILSQRSTSHFGQFKPKTKLMTFSDMPSSSRSMTQISPRKLTVEPPSVQFEVDETFAHETVSGSVEDINENVEPWTQPAMDLLDASNTSRIPLFTSDRMLSPVHEQQQLESARLMEENFHLTTSRSLGEFAGNNVPTVDDLLGDIDMSMQHTYRELCESGYLDDNKLKLYRPKNSRQRPEILASSYDQEQNTTTDEDGCDGEMSSRAEPGPQPPPKMVVFETYAFPKEGQTLAEVSSASNIEEDRSSSHALQDAQPTLSQNNIEEQGVPQKTNKTKSGASKENSTEDSGQGALPADIQEFFIKKLDEGDVRSYVPSRSQLIKLTMYQELPPLKTKTMRVYLGSTGDDMRYERETIIYGSVPEVQAYCKTKGIDFQLIDLSDSFIDNSYMFDPNLVNVRLSELEHCMKYSFAVSSVFLVGEKYGFTPLPRIVDKSEFEILLQYMENYEDKQLAFMVYELDYNSQPVTYIYEEEYVHTVFKESLPREQSAKLSNLDLVKMVSETLMNVFQKAADKAFEAKDFTQKQKMKFFMSVFESEIRKAAPSGRNVNDSLIFVRRFSENNSQNLDVLETYFDIGPDGVSQDTKRRELIDNLIHDVIEQNFRKENISMFNVKWNSRVGVDPEFIQEQAHYLQDLNATFIDNMKRLIDSKLASVSYHSHVEVREERLLHLYYGKKLTDYHCGNTTILRKLTTFLEIPEQKKLFIVWGEAKSGLSTLAAALASEARDYLPVGAVIILRFVQATINSQEALLLLSGILKELCLSFHSLTETVIDEIDSCETLTKCSHLLEKYFKSLPIDENSPAVIIIDGFDHLSCDRNTYALHWLPQKLPIGVNIVVTCADGEVCKRLIGKFSNQDSSNVCQFHRPTVENIADCIHFNLMSNHSKTLSEIQMEVVSKAIHTNEDMLQLDYVVHLTKDWTHAEETMDIEKVLARFKNEVKYFADKALELKPRILSRKILHYLVLFGDLGITEIELRTILSYDQELISKMYQKAPKGHCSAVPLRDSVVSAVFYELRKFLVFETREGVLICRLPLGILRTELEQRFKSKNTKEVDELFSCAVKYLAAEEVIQEPISTLEPPANNQKELVAYCGDFAASGNAAMRMLAILPTLLLSSKRTEQACEQCLFNYDFILSKSSNFSVHALLADYVLAASKGIVFASVVFDTISFLRSKGMLSVSDIPALMLSKLKPFEDIAPDVFSTLLDGARRYISNNTGVWLVPRIQCHLPSASFLRNTFSVIDGTFWEMLSTGSSSLICRTGNGIQEFDVDSQERLWQVNVEAAKCLLSNDKKYLVIVTVAKPVQNPQSKVKETRSLIVYDVKTLTQLASRTMFNNYKCICLSKDSKTIYVGVPRLHQRENSKIYMLKIDSLQTVKAIETILTVTAVEDIPHQKSLLIGGDHNDECVVKMKIDKDGKNFVRGLKGPVIHLHATESGTMAIVGLGMNAIALIDLKKSRIITQQLFDNSRWMSTMRTNKHDKFVVCGDANPGVIVFDCIKGEKVNRLCPSNRDTNIVDATITDNGQFCVVADNYDNSVSVWNCTSGSCLKILRGLKANISTISFICKCSHIAAASISGEVCVWNVSSLFKMVETSKKNAAQFSDSQYSSKEEKRVQLQQNLALNLGKNMNNILNIVTTEVEDQTSFNSTRAQIDEMIVVSIDQKDFLITASCQNGFLLWDLFTGLGCGQLPLEDKNPSYTPVFLFSLPLLGNLILDSKVCGVYNERLYIWEMRSRKIIHTSRISFKFGCVSRDKKVFVSYASQAIANSAKIMTWSLSNDKVEKVFLYEIANVDFAEVKNVFLSNDGLQLVLISSNNWDTSIFVQTFENKTGKNVIKTKYLNSNIDGCFVLSKVLVCSNFAKDDVITFEGFSLENGKLVFERRVKDFEGYLCSKVASKGEQCLLFGTEKGYVYKWVTAYFKGNHKDDWSFKIRTHCSKVTSIAINSTESRFVTSSTDGWIKMWDFSDGALISRFNCLVDAQKVRFAATDSAIVAMLDSAVCRRMALIAVQEVVPPSADTPRTEAEIDEERSPRPGSPETLS